MTATSSPSRPAASPRPPAADLVLLAVAVAAVSTSAPLVRAAAAPALAVAFWRTLLAVPLTGLIVLRRHQGELRGLDNTDRRRTVLSGGLLAAHFATWIPSISFTSVASAVAMVSTMPVWSALIARRQGREVSRGTWRGIAVALVGVVALTGVDLSITPRALVGDLLALVGGALAAAYLAVGGEVRRQVSNPVYTLLSYSVAAGVLVVLCGVGRQPVVGYPSATWLAIVAITVGPQLLGHTLINRVVRVIDTTVIGVALLLEIVGSTLLAWVFFDEVPPVSAVPAGVLLVSGLVMVVRAGRVA